jgi:hypothetical protein
MENNTPQNALIDPRRVDLYALAQRAKVPVPARYPELPPWEVLRLGHLQGLTGVEHSDFGKFVARKVEIHNNILAETRRSHIKTLTYPEYLDVKSKRNRYSYEYDKIYEGLEFTKDYQGYLRYLLGVDPDLERVLLAEMERPRFIQETRDRRGHTLVTGASRSGKTELLKLLIHHYVRHPELGGVLVVDPHGDMAKQIARWQEFAGEGADRLVYLDIAEGMARGGYVPALNPLVRGSAATDELATVAGQLADALVYFGGEGEGLTAQMERVAGFSLQVMLELGGKNLIDLMRGLTPPKDRKDKNARKAAPDFVEFGRRHPIDAIRYFFEDDWDSDSYLSTRDALKRRLSNYFRYPKFWQAMVAPDPIDLEALLSAGKVVVVNCGFEDKAGDAVGRFILAQVAAIGRRRLDNERIPRAPVHVFVDEATQLMAPPFVKILERFAKSRIWLTMGQQGAGDGVERGQVGRVIRNTNLKFLGRSGNVGELAKMLGLPRDGLPILKQGDFIVTKAGEEQTLMLLQTLNPSPLADNGNAMTEAEFDQVMGDQLARYYRRAAEPGRVELPAPAAAPQPDPVDEWRQE